MKMPAARPLPLLTPLNTTFWTAGREGRLCIARCSDCGAWLHPPGPICPDCLGQHLSPQPVSGFGVIETFTVNHQAWTPGTVVPYVVAIVSLAESPEVRLTTNIVGVAPEKVRIGTRVRVLFEQHDDVWMPLFTPA
jgi:uncharacterized OB-fold protein